MLLEEAGLLDPMLPDIESEAGRAQVARQKAVAAGIARAVQESLPAEALRIEALEQRLKLRRSDHGYVVGGLRAAVSFDTPEVGPEGDVHVPRGQRANLLQKILGHDRTTSRRRLTNA